MALKPKFDVLLNKLREKDLVLEYDGDPASPVIGELWVKRTGGGTDGVAGEPRGLLLTLTYTGDVTAGTYELSFRTQAETTVRTALT